MFILDTNVLSELMKAEGASIIVDWADAIPKSELFTTVLNYAEILVRNRHHGGWAEEEGTH